MTELTFQLLTARKNHLIVSYRIVSPADYLPRVTPNTSKILPAASHHPASCQYFSSRHQRARSRQYVGNSTARRAGSVVEAGVASSAYTPTDARWSRRHKIHLLADRLLLRLAKLHSTGVGDKRIVDANYDYSRRIISLLFASTRPLFATLFSISFSTDWLTFTYRLFAISQTLRRSDAIASASD